MWRDKLFGGKMVKNWDFRANYCGDGGQILGGCLGNYWGDGGKILGGCIPHPPGICSPAGTSAKLQA